MVMRHMIGDIPLTGNGASVIQVWLGVKFVNVIVIGISFGAFSFLENYLVFVIFFKEFFLN